MSFLYIFWATVCRSPGEITASMRHLVFVSVWMIADSHPHTQWQIASVA